MATLVYSILVFLWAAAVPFGGATAFAAGGVDQTCSVTAPGAVDATFSWPKATGATQVWLDVSLIDNGFASGSFYSVGPLTASSTTYTWRGIRAGATHYYRVNALYPEGWRLVSSGTFVSGLCQVAPPSIQFPRQECSQTTPGKVKATFSWSPNLVNKSIQWLDLTRFDNGFAPGTFVSAGPLTTTESSHVWDGLEPGARHFWRVNTLTYGGWMTSATGTFTTLSCGAATPPNAGMLAFRDNMASAIAASGLNVAIAVTDLQTGESVDVNGDMPRLAGCTINWFVLLQVVMDLQAGLYPEADVGELIQRTITYSNPITARTLLLYSSGTTQAGVYRINDLLSRLGMSRSLFDHPPAFPDDFSLGGYANILTANDSNRGLASFYHGAVVNDYWREYLMAKMVNVKPGLQYLIPAGVGGGVVSHKNGYSWAPGGYIDNDIGIVRFQSGGNTYAYAISFFSQDVPTEYADIYVGQALSRLAWQYFSNRY